MWVAPVHLWATFLCFVGIYSRKQLNFYIRVLGIEEVPAYIAPSIFSTADASPFPCPQIYSPLNQSVDSLRILRLLPGSGELSCRIESTTFREQPRYRALSYEWGASDRTLPIHIDEVPTRVGWNLWQALYHLRHRREEQVLWVDAICINQHDLAEKARLIPQMSMIFRRAAEVVVWLGIHQAPGAVDLNVMAGWTSPPPYIDVTYHARWWHEAVPWLFDLMHAGYWKRTWIVQEIGEAIKLSVYFGKESLPWGAFNSAVVTYRKCFPTAWWTDRITVLEALRKSRRDGEIYALADLISIFRDTFCKMPHDKIYAFLGMAADDSPGFIPAVYSKSFAEVHSDFMQYLSGSAFDKAVKEFELVHLSALVRYVLTKEIRTTVHTYGKPQSVLREAEPYTYYENSAPDKDGKTHLIAQTAYRKRWYEWEDSQYQREETSWHPARPERLDLWTGYDSLPGQTSALKARGIAVGKIESFGPTIEMFLASHHVSKAWKADILESFRDKPIQKKMVALYERLLDIVGQEAVARSIDSITAFRSHNNSITTRETDSARLFIGSNGFLGIASPEAHIGDHVVQFWKSSASAIVRREEDSMGHGRFAVAGRCAIVREGYSHDWDIPQDKAMFLSEHESSVCLHMSIDTLTALTLNSLDLKDATPEARSTHRAHKF